jgi:hypothetical protein
MPEQTNEPDNANLPIEELRAIRRLIEERLPLPPRNPSLLSPDEARARLETMEQTQKREADQEAKKYPGRRALIREIERQSDTGALDIDRLLRAYYKEYRDPVRMLLQDLQQRAEVYHNVFEQLKNSTDPDNAAAVLKDRYLALGLIDSDNAWPNPWGSGLMGFVNKKLDWLCDAMLQLLRSEIRSLLRELNFEPTVKVGVEFALGVSGPQITFTMQPEPMP